MLIIKQKSEPISQMKSFKMMLGTTQPMASLKDNLGKQQSLLKRIRVLLPKPVDEHCIWSLQKNRDLFLWADSPAWASRIRYFSAKLIQKLCQEGLDVRYVRVKVALTGRQHPQSKRPRRATPLSSANMRLLNAVAESVDDDALRSALMRLSQHGAQ
ncbi:MAG: DciA family protein [Gammaproteobacteria bacterium]|nr:DciA family protein [Gammaproteobacteria bacterium]